MKRVAGSHFVSAVLGGLVVGAAVFLTGTGASHTQTIVDEAPVASEPSASAGAGPTANDIYQHDAPAVVYVHARLVAPAPSPFDMFRSGETDTSTGSGFLVDTHGDILTDYHVIDGADRTQGVSVVFENNITRRATVVAIRPGSDLAVLHVDTHGLPQIAPLRLGDSTTVRVGDPTLTIGNPFGVDRTLTSGIVSALQHRIQAADGDTVDNVIQTDQPLDAGNSGGPLLNAGGDVIGINSQVATVGSGTQPGQALAFAIPIDTADEILASAAHAGPARVAYLGLSGRPSKTGRAGLVVTSVVDGGPAAVGGLRPGDLVQRVDGTSVTSLASVLSLVSTRSPGQTIQVVIRRARRTTTLTVALGSRSAPAGGSD